MSTKTKDTFKKYFTLAEQMPAEFVNEINKSGETLILYGLSSRAKRERIEEWIALTEKHLWFFDKKFRMRLLLNDLGRVDETRSQAMTTWQIFSKNTNAAPQAVIQYTGGLKVVMGKMKYLIEKAIEGENLLDIYFLGGWEATEQYQHSVLKSFREIQNGNDDHKKVLFRLLGYLKPYRKEMSIGALGATLFTVVSLVPGYLSGRMVDDLIRPYQDGSLPMEKVFTLGWWIIAALGTSYLLREVFSWLRLSRMSILGEWVAADLRRDLYDHLQKLGLDYFGSKQTGSIISRVSSDTDRIWDFIAFGIVEVGISIVTLIFLCAMLIGLDTELGLIMTIPVPILMYSIYAHGEKMQRLFLKAWRKWSNLTNVLSDTVPGIQVVKAFNQEGRERSRFNERNSLAADEFVGIHEAWTRFWPLMMLGLHAVSLAVWAVATPRLFSGTAEVGHLTVGTFVSFLLYMTMFNTPIEVIGQMARMLNRALSSAHRIFEVLDTAPTMSNEGKILKDVKGEVEFKNVTFSYDGVRPILKGIDFKVSPGEMIGLVGTSGGGKSTITKLIARFYDTTDGEILIDGENLKSLNPGEFRTNVGMVLQDPYLFHGSIIENIKYGRPDASLGEVVDAARKARAHDFILKLTHGYDTIVGERGHTLSGGERQRISIARAILCRPKLLILDEATSAVDTETERKIQEALDELTEGRTVFAIAHRLSTLRKADRIFVIDDGKIVEIGTHKELLSKKDGKYRKLHEMQQDMNAFFTISEAETEKGQSQVNQSAATNSAVTH